MCVVSLMACAAVGCAAESENPLEVARNPLEVASESDALVAPRITIPASGSVGNLRLDGIVAASRADVDTDGMVQPYMFDLRANHTGAVTLAQAQAIAKSLFGTRVLRVTQRNLLPAQPAAIAPGVRLLGQANRIASEIGSTAAAPSALTLAIAGLDSRARTQAKVFDVQFKPGQPGPQSTFLMFDEGARAGRGACIAAAANIWAD